VGSTELNGFRYGASVRVRSQQKSKDDYTFVIDAIKDRFLQYYQCTGRKPERVLVYRGGLPEGEFHTTMSAEINGIREAVNKLQPGLKIPITYVSVQKRHHTRLFCRNRSDAKGKAENVPPGTVVDTSITHPLVFDFFLAAHFGIQGCSRPAHFAVLFNECMMTSDEIQQLSFDLCHVYARCARSVSLPAPVYYANLAFARAKAHMMKYTGDFSDTQSVTSGGTEDTDAGCADVATLEKACKLVDTYRNAMYFA